MSLRPDREHLTFTVRVRTLVVTAAVVAGVAVGLAVFFGLNLAPRSSGSRPAPPQSDSAAWEAAPQFTIATTGRPAVGAADAPVTVIEFTDYQCPFCRHFGTDVLPRLLARWQDTVRYVVRNFPNLVLHRRAVPAAEAAECAVRQGRFWEFRSQLLEQSPDLSDTILVASAVAAGLDTVAFRECVVSRATKPLIAMDLLEAWEAGVFGTPTFFVNGHRFQGERSFEQLSSYIGFALREAETRGTP